MGSPLSPFLTCLPNSGTVFQDFGDWDKRGELMKTVFGFYDRIEERLPVYSMVFNVILLFFQVCMRTIFNLSPSWSEGLSRYLFMWQTCLGTSIALRENKHIKLDLIHHIIKQEPIEKAIDIIGLIDWLSFSLFLLCTGARLPLSIVRRHALS